MRSEERRDKTVGERQEKKERVIAGEGERELGRKSSQIL